MAAETCMLVTVVLVAGLAVLLSFDPLKLSPLSGLPDFKAKPVKVPFPPPPDASGNPFFRDTQNKLRHEGRLKLIGGVMGPESLAFDAEGEGPYTGIADGRIMRWDSGAAEWKQFATLYAHGSEHCKPHQPPVANLTNEHICGRPLGIHFMPGTGQLYIADAYHGLQVVGREGGESKVVVGEAEGIPFGFTNDLEISSDGIIYFTDSSTNYCRRQFLLAALSGDDTGRLLSYNPSTKEVKVLWRGIQFPNGITISKDESFLVIAETTTCRLSRFWLKGEKSGTLETFVHLPGPPDNVRVNDAGDFWVAIHCRQTTLVWVIFSHPWLRYALLKLPVPIKYLYPIFLGGKPHAMLLRYDPRGNLVEVLEDEMGKTVKLVSEVEEWDGKLWMGSVLMPYVAVYLR